MRHALVQSAELLLQNIAELHSQLAMAGLSSDAIQPLMESLARVETQSAAICRPFMDERKTAEYFRTLEKSALHETLSDWLWQVDVQGNYISVGSKVKESLGYEPDELLGKPPFAFMPPEEAVRVSGIFGSLVESRQPIHAIENINIHKDGRLITLLTTGVPIYDDNGAFAGYSGLDRDITEERMMARDLERLDNENRELSSRMKAAVDSAGIGIWEYDIAGSLLVWDDWMYRLYGIEPDRFSGAYEAWEQGLHPDDMDRSVGELRDAIGGGKPFDTEFRVVHPSGDVHHIKASAVVLYDEAGTPLKMIGTNYDITKRRHLEDELAASVAQLNALYEGIPDAIVVADVETKRIVHCNHAAEEMTGVGVADLKLRTLHSLHPADVLEALLCAFERQAKGELRVIESEVLTASGKRIPVSVTAAQVVVNDKPCLIGAFRDITESKEAEQAIRLANQQLQASEQQLMAANQQLQASEQQLMATNQQLMAKHGVQGLLANISAYLMTPVGEVLDESIEHVLGLVGSFTKADRCYIFQFTDDGMMVSNTYEWCAAGVAAKKHGLQQLAVDEFPWWMERIKRHEPIFIPDVSALPVEAKLEKEYLEHQDIRSLVAVPVSIAGFSGGFLGLDWVNSSVLNIHEDHIPLLQLASDIIFGSLNREQSAQQIREREAKYRAIFESIQDVYVEVNLATGTIEEISPSISSFGYTRDEILHRQSLDYYVNLEERDRLISALVDRGSLRDFEAHFLTKSGESITVSLAISLIKGVPDGLMKIVGTMRDISERKKHECQIQENIRLKNDFISSVSHELRTPLFSILGFSSTLLKESGSLDPATRLEFTSIIHDESVRLSSLIEDILTISRIDSGKAKYSSQIFDPVKPVSAVVAILRRQAEEKGIELVEEKPDREHRVVFDQDSFKQVMMNLLGNALKFTPKGGRVKVSISGAEEMVSITVDDTGIGIAASDHEKIFDRFYRSVPSALQIEGTGLGLAIVKDIVEMQEGSIGVQSELDRGSQFTVLLKRAEEAADEVVVQSRVTE
ncbi:PAS domain S-box protein [Chlorobium phaeovibrioides]|uniref:histidine kinase n=1 Tax=Chlorobium phaeovibrioides TaxID=1094 RepID=A0ABW9UPS1_CHLPH|nr:PAS domain S-box protein [Chlorobium phaeovibrioides]MWV54143.1 PAS domain S-box protein [Chlorobium phaeovibrioides]